MVAAADEIFRFGGKILPKTSVVVKISGVAYTGIFEINYDESREGEYIYGQRPDGTPLGYTQGQYKPGALTFKALADSAALFEQSIGVLGNGSIGNAQFSLTLEIFESFAQPTMSVSIGGCKLEKRKMGVPTDAGALTKEYECKFLTLVEVGEGLGLGGTPSVLANLPADF